MSQTKATSDLILPDGVHPFFMTDSSAQKYNMKTGDGIIDLVNRKTFNTAEVLQEIKTYGFMCAFEPCESYLKDCRLNEFVVVCDTSSKYGEMFLLLYKKISIETFQSEAEAKEKEDKSIQKESKAQKEKDEQEKLARRTMVYIDKPFIANESYDSATTKETEQEIAFMNLQGERRNLHNTTLLRQSKREETYFDDEYSSCVTISPKTTNIQYLDCHFTDARTQHPQKAIENSTQTTWHRKVNKVCQYEPLSISDFGLNYENILGDVSLSIRNVVPSIERVLLENETVDIFSNYFAPRDNPSKDVIMREDEPMKEIRSFTDLDYTKDKLIHAIDLHPKRKDIIAVSVCEPGNIDDKINNSGSIKASHIVLWKFGEQMHPYRILVTPFDCPIFRFNPTLPNIIIGGCDGGQVVMWNTDINSDVQSNDKDRILTAPFAISCPGQSHKRMISDISWLPPHTQINTRGHLLSKEYLTDISHQFYTISGDGQIIFWDTRFEDISQGKLPHIAKIKSTKQTQRKVEWIPLFKIKPKRLSGTGELSLCKSLIPSKYEDSRSVILCSSEEGEMLKVDWSPKLETDANGNKQETDFASPEYVQWMKRDHNRPCVSLSQHGELPDFILTVSDWNFHIWKTDLTNSPVFTSPYTSCHITGGEWSPTRPAVVFISKCNGSIDVWDFTENCYSPTATFSLIPNRIVSTRFLESPNQDGYFIAIGDNVGSLHLFTIPTNLVKSYPNEYKTMCNFLDRCSKCEPFDVSDTDSSAEDDELNKIMNKPSRNEDKSSILETNISNQYHQDDGLTKEEEALYVKLESMFLNT